MLTLDDFDYSLPSARIAQTPLAERAASRLLVASGTALVDCCVRDLPQLLRPSDLLIMNDTRVMHARLFGRKETGGQVEVLVERIAPDGKVIAQLRASKPPQIGMRLRLEDAFTAEVLGRAGEFWQLDFGSGGSGGSGGTFDLIERHGRLPLPPYIEHAATALDEERYQTVFACVQGSVAAPTAGLHFDAPLLTALAGRNIATTHITLHVGAGTFQPVRVHDLARHRMHREHYHVPAATVDAVAACHQRGGRVVAVGTTTLRALESAALGGALQAGSNESELFIMPGFKFRVVDVLMTNFHLPKSTLLMLVAAFGGLAEMRVAYQHALAHDYRFFSYGDAMLIDRK